LYLFKNYSSSELIETANDGTKFYPGDKLFEYQEHLQNKLLTGFDFDATMLRIAAMNLLLHGIDNPQIHNQDTLSSKFPDKYPDFSENYFDIILANPPFKGSLDFEDVNPQLIGKVKTKKTELLFLINFLRMLKIGGKAAIIVPEGVLFGSSKAHLAVRKLLIEENQLEAVISLPAGVFKPYAGVSTAIILFTKGGRTENVWYFDVENDGYTLDDKRLLIQSNDLPEVYQKWVDKDIEVDNDKLKKNFFVSVTDIRNNLYDLSITRYREIIHKEIVYDQPQVILNKLKSIEEEIKVNILTIEKDLFI